MPKTYTKAKPDDDASKIVFDTIDKNYKDLQETDVKIAVIFVEPALDDNGVPKAPAIKFAGVGAAAKIKVESPENRALYKADARLLIDKHGWDDLTHEQQCALIDHELCHLVVCRDSKGMVVQHDDLRPKLRTRPDDWLINGFREVVERHGSAAIDYQNVKAIVFAKDSNKNMLFDFAADLGAKPKREKVPA